MKKIIISISLLLAITALSISLLSCNGVDNTSKDSEIDQTTPMITTTKEPETTTTPITDQLTMPMPALDPEPVIDMDALYRKVFENHSKRYNLNETPELKDLDKSTDPVIMYFLTFVPETKIFEDKIWIIEGVSADVANGLLEKYSVDPCNNFTSPADFFIKVHGYYHTAYLDVLFKNVTFEKTDKMPDVRELTRLAKIKGDENHPDRYYYAYEDMKLYYEENGVVYRSVQNVDSPYLHVIPYLYHYQWQVGSIIALNTDPDEEGTPKKVTVEESDGNLLEYSIYPSGKVYSQVIDKVLATHNEVPELKIALWGEYRRYFPTEEHFRAFYEGKIKE